VAEHGPSEKARSMCLNPGEDDALIAEAARLRAAGRTLHNAEIACVAGIPEDLCVLVASAVVKAFNTATVLPSPVVQDD
jgi:hypothetical protein